MKRLFALGLLLAVSGCGSDGITAARLGSAVGTSFEHRYVRQQQLLGGPGVAADVQAACSRGGATTPDRGPGDDWACTVTFVQGSRLVSARYDVRVQADGCYDADGSAAVVGAAELTGPTGKQVVNPLYAFDGCFDT